MQYIKKFESFYNSEEENVLKDILRELDYFHTSVDKINSRVMSDSDNLYFSVMSDCINKYQSSYRYKMININLKPLDKINEIIMLTIENRSNGDANGFGREKLKFDWSDISDVVKESVTYMESRGWRSILEPMFNGISWEYTLETIDEISDKHLEGFYIKFYC